MSLTWTPESPARWDANKGRIVGGAGVFDLDQQAGAVVPGEWWRVEQDGAVVGYGWMDVTWGYAPVLLAVDPAARGAGVGSFIMENLVREAHKRGLAYVFNAIPPRHADPDGLSAWLQARGFESSESDGKLLRRRVQDPVTPG